MSQYRRGALGVHQVGHRKLDPLGIAQCTVPIVGDARNVSSFDVGKVSSF